MRLGGVYETRGDSEVGNAAGTATINLRFPGQYYDSESGLHYNYFRDYDPETGRYVKSDPIGLDGGLNTYGYVEGNPVNYSDFFGLAKGGRQNQSDSGLANLSDEEISQRARDKSLSGEERRRCQKEEKARGERNRNKRRNNSGKLRSITGPQIHIELACSVGAAPCELCEALDYPNPNCPVDLWCEAGGNTPASPTPPPPPFPGWSSAARPNIIDLGQQ